MQTRSWRKYSDPFRRYDRGLDREAYVRGERCTSSRMASAGRVGEPVHPQRRRQHWHERSVLLNKGHLPAGLCHGREIPFSRARSIPSAGKTCSRALPLRDSVTTQRSPGDLCSQEMLPDPQLTPPGPGLREHPVPDHPPPSIVT